MNDQQKQITFNVFKHNIVFIALTAIIVVFLIIPAQAMRPIYNSYVESVIGAIIAFPILALWLMHFWNKILMKLFPNIPNITYGVSLVLSIMLSMLI